MEIIIGRATKYFRERGYGDMQDPTMTYVTNVASYVESVISSMTCEPVVERLDKYTFRITLPKGYTFRE